MPKHVLSRMQSSRSSVVKVRPAGADELLVAGFPASPPAAAWGRGWRGSLFLRLCESGIRGQTNTGLPWQTGSRAVSATCMAARLPGLLSQYPSPSRDVRLVPGLRVGSGGAEEIRTPDLRRAKAALSQLSYGPSGCVHLPVGLIEYARTSAVGQVRLW